MMERCKITIINFGEGDAMINMAMTIKEWRFLEKVANALNNSRERYAPVLSVINDDLQKELKIVKEMNTEDLTDSVINGFRFKESKATALAMKAEAKELLRKYTSGEDENPLNVGSMAVAFKKAMAMKNQ